MCKRGAKSWEGHSPTVNGQQRIYRFSTYPRKGCTHTERGGIMLLDQYRYFKTQFQSGGLRGDEKETDKEQQLMEVPFQFIAPRRIDSRDMCLSSSHQHQTPHCFTKGMNVLMEDGDQKDIKDVATGEYVISGNGVPRRVNGKMSRVWQGNVLSLKVKGNYKPIDVTPEHPFWVKRRKHGSLFKTADEPCWVNANDINKGDLVLIMDEKDCTDKTLYSIEKDKDFLWLLGLYIGDGWVRKNSNEISFAINLRDIDTIVSKTTSIIERLFNITPHVDIREAEHTAIVRLSHKRLAEMVKELGGEKHDKKRINKRLLTMDPCIQINIIKGWMAADGWSRQNRKEQGGVTTSKELALQIRRILTRFGLKSSLTMREQKNRKASYIISLYGIHYDNFILEKLNKDEIWLAIESVGKKVCPQTVYNLSVDVDETYIIEGIKTHNCAGYTAAGYIEYYNWKTFHYPAQVDGDEIYAEAKKIDNYSGDGTNLISVSQASINLNIIKGVPKRISYDSVNRSNLSPHEKLIISAKFSLHKYGVVMAGFLITNEWDWVDKRNGFIRDLGDKAIGNGGHAVLLCGYDNDGVYIQNSWGEDWGHYGFAILKWEQYCRQIMQAMVIEAC